jgi:hypothetical protein
MYKSLSNDGDGGAISSASTGFESGEKTTTAERADFPEKLENTMVEWTCPKCGNVAQASDVYDEKICMKGGCGTHMKKGGAEKKNSRENALTPEQLETLDRLAVKLYGKKYRDLDSNLEAQDDLIRRVTGEYSGVKKMENAFQNPEQARSEMLKLDLRKHKLREERKELDTAFYDAVAGKDSAAITEAKRAIDENAAELQRVVNLWQKIADMSLENSSSEHDLCYNCNHPRSAHTPECPGCKMKCKAFVKKDSDGDRDDDGEKRNGSAECNECGRPMTADGKGGWTGHAPGCSTGAGKGGKKENADDNEMGACVKCRHNLAYNHSPEGKCLFPDCGCTGGSLKNADTVGIHCPKGRKNSSQIDSPDWELIDESARVGWLDASGQDIALASLKYADLSEDVKVALQSAWSGYSSQNNKYAEAAEAKAGAGANGGELVEPLLNAEDYAGKAQILTVGGGAKGWIIADAEGRKLFGPYPSYSAADADFKRRNLVANSVENAGPSDVEAKLKAAGFAWTTSGSGDAYIIYRDGHDIQASMVADSKISLADAAEKALRGGRKNADDGRAAWEALSGDELRKVLRDLGIKDAADVSYKYWKDVPADVKAKFSSRKNGTCSSTNHCIFSDERGPRERCIKCGITKDQAKQYGFLPGFEGPDRDKYDKDGQRRNAKPGECPSCGSTETFSFKGAHGDNMACTICDRTWDSTRQNPMAVFKFSFVDQAGDREEIEASSDGAAWTALATKLNATVDEMVAAGVKLLENAGDDGKMKRRLDRLDERKSGWRENDGAADDAAQIAREAEGILHEVKEIEGAESMENADGKAYENSVTPAERVNAGTAVGAAKYGKAEKRNEKIVPPTMENATYTEVLSYARSMRGKDTHPANIASEKSSARNLLKEKFPDVNDEGIRHAVDKVWAEKQNAGQKSGAIEPYRNGGFTLSIKDESGKEVYTAHAPSREELVKDAKEHGVSVK